MKEHYKKMNGLVAAVFLVAAISVTPCYGGGSSTEDLAKKTQNPVSDLISVPFQNNINFDVGPMEKTQNILNIQPVYPLSLNEDWNLITRTIMPVISQPAMTGNLVWAILRSQVFSPLPSPGNGSGVLDRFSCSPRQRMMCWARINGAPVPRPLCCKWPGIGSMEVSSRTSGPLPEMMTALM